MNRRWRTGRVWPIVLLLSAACAYDDEPASPQVTQPETPTSVASSAAETEWPSPETPSEQEPLFVEAWERLADSPLALTELAAAAHDGRIWVVGGFTADGSASRAVLIFDPVDESWSDGPRLPVGVHHSALISVDDVLYLLGGFLHAGFQQPTAQVWVLEMGADEWAEGPVLPEARGAAAAAWDGSRIVFGGGVGPEGVASDVYALDDAWERFGELSEPRQHLAATSDGHGRVWFLGGRQSSLETNIGSVDLLEGGRIARLPAELTPRSGAAAVWGEGIGACLLGGETPAGTLSAVECLTTDGQVLDLPPLTVARHGLGVALLDDGIYALMGGEEPGLFVSRVTERLPAR